MMYGVRIHSYRKRPFCTITPPGSKGIATKMRFYARQPEPLQFAEPLTGSHTCRFRIGDYRVIFKVVHDAIWIVAIKRRDKAYQ